MKILRALRFFGGLVALILPAVPVPEIQAQEQLLVAYGGHNESVASMWVGIEKGLFKKYGLDVRVVQVRSGPMIMSAMASRDVLVGWAIATSVLNAASGGLRMSFIASPNVKIVRDVMVRRDIKSLDDLRGRVLGVQSIGGGTWLNALIVLDALGVDPDKYGLKIRVIGDETAITQALLAEMIDVAVLTHSFSEVLKRAGFRSLADTAELNVAYQGSGMAALRDVLASSPDLITRLLKGMIEAVAFIHDPNNKQDVSGILKKNLRLAKAEDAEASYRVLRSTTSLDVAPNIEAWRKIRRFLSPINPKVGQADLTEVLNGSFVQELEKTGFLPEMRRKMMR